MFIYVNVTTYYNSILIEKLKHRFFHQKLKKCGIEARKHRVVQYSFSELIIMMQQLSRARVHYLAKSISNNTLLLNRIPKHFPSSYRYASSSSDDNLRKTIDEMKQRQNKNSENPGDASTNNKSDSSEPTNMNLSGWKEWTVQSYEKLVYNVRVAYDEMVGENQESILTKKVHQAESFRKEKKKEEADEEDEQPTVETVDANAPSALVVMKEPKGAWEQMKERLQDSPFIREILKKSKVVGSAAASTDLGKTAQNVGQSVKDKVGDLREFWETSQNPIIYTLSGVWDNMTGETEEGIALTEIKKLDPKFSKVLFSVALLLNCYLF